MIRVARLYLAIAMLRTSRLLCEAGGRIVEAHILDAQKTGKSGYFGTTPKPSNSKASSVENDDLGITSAPLKPVEQMLLGSIVGLSICVLWIWFSARAGL